MYIDDGSQPCWGPFCFALAAPGGLPGGDWQNLLKTLLSKGEHSFHLTADEDSIAQIPQRTEWQRVLHLVGDTRACYAVLALGLDAVAMLPTGEGAFQLLIAEMAVPDKIRDAGQPSDAERDTANGAEADDHL